MIRQYGGVGSGFLGVQVDAPNEDRVGAVAEAQDDKAGGVGQQIAPGFVFCVRFQIGNFSDKEGCVKAPVATCSVRGAPGNK